MSYKQMQAIDYDIEAVDLQGLSLTPLELLKSEEGKEYWEAEANHVSLVLSFQTTALHEIRLGVMTGVLFRVEAGNDRLMRDKVVLVDRVEAAVPTGCRRVRYGLNEVCGMQFRSASFSRVIITIDNTQKDRRIRIGYICLYHQKGYFQPNSAVFAPSKRPKLTDFPVLKPPILPPTPPSRIPLDVSLQLLNDCTVTSLGYSEHVQTLCRVLGASYLDHIEKRTTHVIIAENCSHDDEALYETNAKLVSVAWLEKCLFEKVRQPEEDYELL